MAKRGRNGSAAEPIAEDIRQETLRILRAYRRKSGTDKMSWRDFEKLIEEYLAKKHGLKLNRGFLIGLLLVQKFHDKVCVSIELDEC